MSDNLRDVFNRIAPTWYNYRHWTIFRRELEKAENPEAVLEQKIREYREKFANPYEAAKHLHVDDVINPLETRARLITALEMVKDKVEGRPQKKHGIIPA
jgi:acetyl-CoA carboxylase carboxyltransferase component